MKKVTVNNNMYLGSITRSGKKTYLKSAMQIVGPDVRDEDIEEYFCRRNNNTLETDMEIIDGRNTLISGLSKIQKIYVKRCKASLEYAKEAAVPAMENQIFRETMGK